MTARFLTDCRGECKQRAGPSSDNHEWFALVFQLATRTLRCSGVLQFRERDIPPSIFRCKAFHLAPYPWLPTNLF
ncbi:MAG: hypothetical protein RL434_2761 [Pseudomonadota bacterium]|jgi:hypothetical protein